MVDAWPGSIRGSVVITSSSSHWDSLTNLFLLIQLVLFIINPRRKLILDRHYGNRPRQFCTVTYAKWRRSLALSREVPTWIFHAPYGVRQRGQARAFVISSDHCYGQIGGIFCHDHGVLLNSAMVYSAIFPRGILYRLRMLPAKPYVMDRQNKISDH